MLAQSTVQESGGHSAASEALSGGNAGSATKGKKVKGLAGLFSDILSQAQKNLGSKDAKALKNGAAAGEGERVSKSGPHSDGIHRAQPSHKEPGVSSAGKNAASSKLVAANKLGSGEKVAKASAEEAVSKGEKLSGARIAKESAAAESGEKTVHSHETRSPETPQPTASSDASAAAEQKSKASADKRRPKGEVQADEAAYALASLKTLSPNARAAAPKAGESSIDADSTITIEGGKRGGRSSSKPELTVLDLRHQGGAKRAQPGKEASGGDAAVAETVKASPRGAESSQDSGSAQFRELTLDARGTGESGSLTQARSDSEIVSGRGQDFQSMLSERLRDQWNGDIVQSAHIVLRDGDAGTIRLRLKPESLGNVKIELNLSDNNISGKIVVESDEAKTAFEKNMNDLSDAFKQGGFDSARLEVSVGSGSGGGTQAQGGRSDASPDPFFSERLRSAVSSPAAPATAASAYSRSGSSVDMFA